MTRKAILISVAFCLCGLLPLMTRPAHAQEKPERIEITYMDTSRFPAEMRVYVEAYAADGRRHTAVFHEMIQLFEDGAEVQILGMTDAAPRGTSLTFLIDADQAAQSHWDSIKEAVLEYANPAAPWMDEDSDYVTLIVANGQERQTLEENTQFHNAVFNAFLLETGESYTPPIAAATPLNDLIKETLDAMAGEPPRPGMYRALIVFSSGDEANSEHSVEEMTALASQRGIHLFTVQLGQDDVGEQNLRRLARSPDDSFFRLDAADGLIPLWEIVSSHRQQYEIIYRSRIKQSGQHTVKVQLSDAAVGEFDFPLTVLEPVVEITLPEVDQVIQRKPPKPESDVVVYEPKTQAIKYLLSWPDEHERDLQLIQLRVDKAVHQQLDLTQSDDRSLIWDIASLEPGRHSLRVEVTDELGLTGQSREIPVTIEFLAVPTPPSPEVTATTPADKRNFASVLKDAVPDLRCITLSGLSLGGIFALLFAYRRRLSAAKASPVSVLRRSSIFRPIDSILINIERIIGSIPGKKPKISLPDLKKHPVAQLEVLEGPVSASSPITIEQETTFGRSSKRAQIVIPDRTVSRLHARVLHEHGDKYRIYNHSDHDTWVNEQRVPEYGLLLKDGDEIRMGRVRLQFRSKKR